MIKKDGIQRQLKWKPKMPAPKINGTAINTKSQSTFVSRQKNSTQTTKTTAPTARRITATLIATHSKTQQASLSHPGHGGQSGSQALAGAKSAAASTTLSRS
jgi:hypothetical protein